LVKKPGVPDAPADLVPLTRKSKDGKTYFRRSELEEEIRKAQQRPLQDLISGTPKVSDACLLYFIRNYWPDGASRTHDAMVMELLSRIDRRVAGLTFKNRRRDDIRADIRQWFLDKLYSRSDALDAYEYIFGRALKRRVFDRVDYYALHDGTELEPSSFDTAGEGVDDSDDVIDALNLRSRPFSTPAAEILTELRELLAQMTPKEREAFIATEYFELDQKEAGEIIGVGKRRIRQLLQDGRDRIRKNQQGGSK
jgi:DNA-directed RNA polymerase specialized sigma24 family protein